jgi:hypothetical protein
MTDAHRQHEPSAWAFELTHLAPVVLERLQAALATVLGASLRFVPGLLPEPPSRMVEEAERRSVTPSAGAVSKAEEIAAEIEDEELRARVARAVALSLERALADRRF